MTITTDTPVHAILRQAQKDGWTVHERGKRVVCTKGKEVRYLGGGEANPRWDTMRALEPIA